MDGAFISHSREDKELVKKISATLHHANIKPHVAELEKHGQSGKLSAIEIKRMIEENSSWTLVFLTHNVITYEHTRNWVAYEIGVSHGLNRPIWVFEDGKYEIIPKMENRVLVSSTSTQKFVVPYLDVYVLFDFENKQDWDVVKEVIKKYGEYYKSAGWKPKVSGVAGAILGPHSEFSETDFKCPKCKNKYRIIKKQKIIICPICRKYILTRGLGENYP